MQMSQVSSTGIRTPPSPVIHKPGRRCFIEQSSYCFHQAAVGGLKACIPLKGVARHSSADE